MVLAIELPGRCRSLGNALLDPYRPERHYMRGPGPKWQAKHDQTARSLARPARPVRRAVVSAPQTSMERDMGWLRAITPFGDFGLIVCGTGVCLALLLLLHTVPVAATALRLVQAMPAS
jgi:hypothetical protein